jgi:hypothetical protein
MFYILFLMWTIPFILNVAILIYDYKSKNLPLYGYELIQIVVLSFIPALNIFLLICISFLTFKKSSFYKRIAEKFNAFLSKRIL